MRDPVIPVNLALYGHPDDGSCWEAWSPEKMKQLGFRTFDGWLGCYLHPRESLFMTVYVDDLKLAGPCNSVKARCKIIAEAVSIEPSIPMERYLGCSQTGFWSKMGVAFAVGSGLSGVESTQDPML